MKKHILGEVEELISTIAPGGYPDSLKKKISSHTVISFHNDALLNSINN